MSNIMDLINQHSVLLFTIRVILGVLFFFQGFDKVFKIKISGVVDFFKNESRHVPIPGFILISSAYITSYIELICGAMLIIGLFTNYALYFLCFDVILVVGAFSLLKPMWDMQLVLPRLLLLFALLYLPQQWDIISVDYLLYIFKK